jgi:histidinol phosphatase-like PHP family hydrolase
MYDLHTHTTFSDGVLIPSELIRRAEEKGYKGIGITDHADFSNYKLIIENLLNLKKEVEQYLKIGFIVGIEITHVIPEKIDDLAKKAKDLGADIVVVHGETIVEPVAVNTNYFALSSKYVDVLAHPGIITEKDIQIAKKNNKFLEITTRKGHSITNGHVFKTARKFGVNLVLNNDAHTPSDLLEKDMLQKVVFGAGGTLEDYKEMVKNSELFFEKC